MGPGSTQEAAPLAVAPACTRPPCPAEGRSPPAQGLAPHPLAASGAPCQPCLAAACPSPAAAPLPPQQPAAAGSGRWAARPQLQRPPCPASAGPGTVPESRLGGPATGPAPGPGCWPQGCASGRGCRASGGGTPHPGGQSAGQQGRLGRRPRRRVAPSATRTRTPWWTWPPGQQARRTAAQGEGRHWRQGTEAAEGGSWGRTAMPPVHAGAGGAVAPGRASGWVGSDIYARVSGG